MNGQEASMVTLRSNGGDLDGDAPVVNYNLDGTDECAEEGVCGAPRAILTCRKNSHPFYERVLKLDQPVKIGRSVARTRPSLNNGIFDCKVLSRNHALMWYENEKFYIQDTKSSNGTFVNSQRLSRGAEDSPPREIWSGDVLQFGVDVLENQRKGNGDNSDDSVHIVTHGCIVATVKLIYPNGKEAKSCSSSNGHISAASYTQEEICKLQLIIYEAQQREERLHAKLEELHSIISMLQDSCHDTLNVRFEETRLLSKIENHEKRTKVLTKIKPGSMESSELDVVNQLLRDVEKVQTVSQEIQERLHRQLLESEESLTVAKIDATNLKLEIQNLRDFAKISENSVQEIAAKCTKYVSTIETLEEGLKTQIKNNMDLESRLEGLQQQEAKFRKMVFTQPINQFASEKLIPNEWDDDLPPKKECDPILLEWYDKFYPFRKDKINEQDSWKLIRRLLETPFSDMEQARKEYEKLSAQKQVLLGELETARVLKNQIIGEGDSQEIGMLENANETVTQLENELREVEEFLWEAAFEKKILENRCSKIKLDLDNAMNSCADKQSPVHAEKADFSDSEVTVGYIRHLIETLKSETEKREKSYEKIISNKNKDECTQTEKIPHQNKETNTEVQESFNADKTSNTPIEGEAAQSQLPAFRIDDGNMTIRRGHFKEKKQLLSTIGLELASSQEPERIDGNEEKVDDTDEKSCIPDEPDSTPSEDTESSIITCAIQDVRDASRRLEEILKSVDGHADNSMWDNVKKIHAVCDVVLSEVPRSAQRLHEIKNLLNLVSEDLVGLLVREQKMVSQQQKLQERLDKSLSQADVAALSLADRFFALVIGLVICYAGSRLLEYLGLES